MSFPIPLTNLLLFTDHHYASRYERYQNVRVLNGDSERLRFHKFGFLTGGAEIPLIQGSTYRLLVNGNEMAQHVGAGEKSAYFTLDLTTLPDQTWLKLEIVGSPGEVTIPWAMFFNRVAGAPVENPPPAPVIAGSFDWVKASKPEHYFLEIPSAFRPTEQPLAVREYPPVAVGDELVRTNVAVRRGANIRRLVRTPEGAVHTFNRQAYFFSDLIATYPRFPLLDGPRGRGSITMPTHVQPGRGNKFYVCEPWRFIRVHEDGYVHTLAGWRHRQEGETPPTGWGKQNFWQEQDLEFVGTWDDSVPEDRRRFRELWGNAFWQRSIETNEEAAELPPEPGHSDVWQKPHKIGVRAFLADSQMDRVVSLQFSPIIHGAPVISEFFKGADCWDVVNTGIDTIAVSVRQENRIVEVRADTGEFVRNIVQGPAYGLYATVQQQNRFVVRSVTLEQSRTADCLLPEGLACMDGWLYWGSVAQREVRRVNLTTGEIQVVCRPKLDNNSNFIKIAVSDGTFLPRHTVFSTSWTVATNGYPEAFVPQEDGTWKKLVYVRIDPGYPRTGRASAWSPVSYGSAVGVGDNRLAFGSAAEGLVMFSRALDTDAPIDVAKYRLGADEWHPWIKTHGDAGFGFAGLPLPWGKSEAMDYYLRVNGHAPTGEEPPVEEPPVEEPQPDDDDGEEPPPDEEEPPVEEPEQPPGMAELTARVQSLEERLAAAKAALLLVVEAM
jgi:hypothetical protein